MSRLARPPSEAEVQTWETEDDDMAEGDLGYGLGRRPGGIYEVQVSHLSTSRKRSDGKNFSPPPFPGAREERSGAIFQYSRNKSSQDAHSEEFSPYHYRRQSSTGKNASGPLPLPPLWISSVPSPLQRTTVGHCSGFWEFIFIHLLGLVIAQT